MRDDEKKVLKKQQAAQRFQSVGDKGTITEDENIEEIIMEDNIKQDGEVTHREIDIKLIEEKKDSMEPPSIKDV